MQGVLADSEGSHRDSKKMRSFEHSKGVNDNLRTAFERMHGQDQTEGLK